MSLWADYYKERLDASVIENDRAFIAYQLFPDHCFILELYVSPVYRQSGIGKDLVEQVKKEAVLHGCKTLTASISPESNHSSETMIASLQVGFKLFKSTNNSIIIYQELK